MTTNAIEPVVEYVEDGATTARAVPFKFKASAHLVVQRITGGAAITLALGVDYTVTGAGDDDGGQVDMTSGGTIGTVLRISRLTPRVQGMDYTPHDTFPAEAHEEALDTLSLIDQEQDADLDLIAARAILEPEGSAGVVLPAKSQRVGGKILGFNSVTGSVEVQDGSDFQGDPGVAIEGVRLRKAVLWVGNSIVAAPSPLTPATELLGDYLGDTWEVINLGFSGATAAQISAIVTDLLAQGYVGVVVIFAPDAVNSVRVGVTAAAIKITLQAMYSAAKTAGADAVAVLTDSGWKYYVDGNPAFSWDAAKQLITEEVNTWKLLDAIDVDYRIGLYAALDDPADPGALLAIYANIDKLHLIQAGQQKMFELVRDGIPWSASTALAEMVAIGRQAVVDQDVSKFGSPDFFTLRAGAFQGPFGPDKPVFEAWNDGDGGDRGVGIGYSASLVGGRKVAVDITFGFDFYSTDQSVNGGRCAGFDVPARHWGTGYGALAFYTSEGGGSDRLERYCVAPWGDVGIGTTNPQRKLVVSNDGAEGLEIDSNGSGEMLVLAFDRDLAAYTGINYWATRHVFTAEGAGLVEMNSNRLVFYVPPALPSFTVATVPSAATKGAGALIYVSDEVGGATPAFSDATNWRRVSDLAIVA